MLVNTQLSENSPHIFRIANHKLHLDITAVEVGYNQTPPNFTQYFVRDVFILHYIENGKGVFLGQRFDSRNGYLVLPHEKESITSDALDPYESYWIIFKGESSKKILKRLNLTQSQVFTTAYKTQCIQCIKKVLFKTDYKSDLEEALALQAALFEILTLHSNETAKNDYSTNNKAQMIASVIRTNYASPLKIGDLAKEFCITRSYLYKIFKKEYDASPQEYLLNRRIEKAKQIMEDPDTRLPIKLIANAVGFEDSMYFSRLFHSKIGVSPSEYIKNIDHVHNELKKHVNDKLPDS